MNSASPVKSFRTDENISSQLQAKNTDVVRSEVHSEAASPSAPIQSISIRYDRRQNN